MDKTTHTEALQKAAGFLTAGGQHAIFTPNPEMLVKAQKDEYFKKVLNSSDLNLCDGFGLWLAVSLRGAKRRGNLPAKIERVTGVDFMLDVCRLAAEQGRGVYLLGTGDEKVIKKTAQNLQKQFPRLKIVGLDKGPQISELGERENPAPRPSPHRGGQSFPLPYKGRGRERGSVAGLEIDQQENDRIISQINQSQAEIVFVAFGMGKQEKWIYENLSKIPSVKIAIGVGGAFDYISGKIPRSPRLMRKIGLEWVYRLIRQPSRFFRIFNATVKFSLLVLGNSKIKNQNEK